MSQKMPFAHSYRYLGRGVLQVEVHGYLDTAVTEEYLAALSGALKRAHDEHKRSIGLLFKDDLSGFDVGKVAMLHAEWIRKFGEVLSGVAIVSTRLAVRFGVAAAKLVAKRPIQLFEDDYAAREWLESLSKPDSKAAQSGS